MDVNIRAQKGLQGWVGPTTWRISDIDFLENGCQSLESGFERHAICEI